MNRFNRSTVLTLAGLAACLVLAWQLLDSSDPPAPWVSARSPWVAVEGQTFPVEVRLNPAGLPSFLVAGLRWSDWSRDSNHFLSSTGPIEVRPGTNDYSLQLAVPKREQMAFVYLILYAGPSAGWTERTHEALSGPIPVRSDNGSVSTVPAMHARKLYSLSHDGSRVPESSNGARLVSGILLLLAGLIHSLRVSEMTGDPGTSHASGRVKLGLCVGLCVAGLSEIFDLAATLSVLGRGMARGLGVYQWRGPVQHLVSVLIAVAALGGCMGVLRLPMRGRIRVALAAGLVYVALAVLGALSLHGFDALAARSFLGITALQWAKLACAGTIFMASICRGGSDRKLPVSN